MLKVMPQLEQRAKIPRTTSLNDTLFIRTLSYNRLPPQLCHLSVVKLNGSTFDIEIRDNSTVKELKQAVEEAFSWSPKVGQGKISWSHVWGYFCLHCQGRDLVNDKVTIRSLGIKDGDQLKFVRHMSLHHKSKFFRLGSRHDPMEFNKGSALEIGKTFGDDDPFPKDVEENELKDRYDEEEVIPKPKVKFRQYLKGWFAYSKLWASKRKASKHSQRIKQAL